MYSLLGELFISQTLKKLLEKGLPRVKQLTNSECYCLQHFCNHKAAHPSNSPFGIFGGLSVY